MCVEHRTARSFVHVIVTRNADDEEASGRPHGLSSSQVCDVPVVEQVPHAMNQYVVVVQLHASAPIGNSTLKCQSPLYPAASNIRCHHTGVAMVW